jgi:hypothetical protein
MRLLLDNSIPWGRLLHDYIQKYFRVVRPFRITRFGVATLAVFQELGRDLPPELRTIAKARASDVLQCATPLLRECDVLRRVGAISGLIARPLETWE